MTNTEPTPTSLYRYYDGDGELLYVGITTRGPQRQTEHNVSSEWWPYVRRQEVEHLPTRETALDRERDLIQRHRPPFNRQHNDDHQTLKAAYLARITRRADLQPTAECSPCPGDVCEWDPWGVRVVGCGRVACSRCHADWHGQQRAWREAQASEALDFIAYLDGRTDCKDADQAAAAREILRLGAWLLERVQAVAEQEDDDLSRRRAAMLARHFTLGYALTELDGVRS